MGLGLGLGFKVCSGFDFGPALVVSLALGRAVGWLTNRTMPITLRVEKYSDTPRPNSPSDSMPELHNGNKMPSILLVSECWCC